MEEESTMSNSIATNHTLLKVETLIMDLDITLITTPPNEVLEALRRLPDTKLTVIEPLTSSQLHINNSTYQHINISTHQHINTSTILICYRCPRLIPEEIYSRYDLAVNIHPSLLPKYAGLNPWEEMFANCETTGGVTIHRLSPQADQGEILMQHDFPFSSPITLESARHEADKTAAKMIVELIKQYQLQ